MHMGFETVSTPQYRNYMDGSVRPEQKKKPAPKHIAITPADYYAKSGVGLKSNTVPILTAIYTEKVINASFESMIS